jgi:hypothetical protein
MATKVTQRTPWEPLLDANRTQKLGMRLRLWRASQTFPGVQIDSPRPLAIISFVFVCVD